VDYCGYSRQNQGAYFKLESNSSRQKVSFVTLKWRLVQFVNRRVQNGDFTERGLARILGISQSHVHNVLKGARKLQPELADHLMSRLDMSVLDLLESSELSGQASLRADESDRNPAHRDAEPGAHVPMARLGTLRHGGTVPAQAEQLKFANIKAR
jgi:plasmid maintenance system antidote protein VapI